VRYQIFYITLHTSPETRVSIILCYIAAAGSVCV